MIRSIHTYYICTYMISFYHVVLKRGKYTKTKWTTNFISTKTTKRFRTNVIGKILTVLERMKTIQMTWAFLFRQFKNINQFRLQIRNRLYHLVFKCLINILVDIKYDFSYKQKYKFPLEVTLETFFNSIFIVCKPVTLNVLIVMIATCWAINVKIKQ